MRRTWISCLLFFVMIAGAAWAAPQIGLSSAPPAAGVQRVSLQQARSALHDAMLFGDTLVERRSGRDLSGSVWMFRFADKTTGTARSISVYVASHSRARTLAVGLYTDERGHPGSLLASGSLSAPQTRTWNNVTIKPAAVKMGHAYWVAVLAEGGTLYFRDRSHGSCPSESSPKSHLSALPASARTGQRSNTCPISAYVSGKIAVSTGNASHGGDGTRFWRRRSKPTNTLPPSISGTARQGQTLRTSNGSWSNSPSSYSYQWQDCTTTGCSNIAGATGSGYTLAASDVGSAIDVIVTATNSAGSASATSAHTANVTPLPPSNSALPQVTGTPTQYQTLTTTNGSWTNSPTSYSYQWQDCDSSGANCANISGATSGSYTLASGDVSHTIRAVVTAANSGGSAAASSVQTSVIAAEPPPVNTALPQVSGTTTQGQTLTASNGSWSNSPSSYSYQWQDCNSSGGSCSNIAGATSSSYTVAVSDVNHTIVVVVTARNAGGSASASSAATSLVPTPTPVNTAPPTISGTAADGDTLTASPGSWANCGSGACTFAYQWKDCNSSGTNCTAISGAISASYALASSDVGSTIDVVVTASNAGGSASVSSAATSVVVGGGGALPSGVTLQVIDGGSNYYCSHGFTEACSGGWDSRSFFPIGPFWENYAGEQSTWTTLGWNTEFYTTSQTDVNALASDGRFSIPAATVTPNANTVGFDAYDEPPTWSAATGPLTSTSNANQDGRFWYVNNTFNMMQFNQPGSSSPGGTQSSFFSAMVSTPNGATRHFDIGSIDLYWFATGTTGYTYNSLIDGGDLYKLGGNMPQSEAMCGCRYGDMLRSVFGTSVGLPSGKSEAPWQTTYPAPIFQYIETGDGFVGGGASTTLTSGVSAGATDLPVASTAGFAPGQQVTIDSGNGSYETNATITSVPDSTDVDVTALTKSHVSGASVYSGVNVITPPELNWSVWSTIIHGGRGIIYFDHSNTASGCVSDNFATTSCAKTVQAHQSVSIDQQMASTDSEIKSLAPEINSETALGYVTVNPAPTTFGGIEDRAVWDTSSSDCGSAGAPCFYIFADTRDAETASNVNATFTTVGKYSGSIPVVGESRTVTATNGTFNDTFAHGSTVHIYGPIPNQ